MTRRRLTPVSIVAGLGAVFSAGLLVGCGEDDPPVPKAVFWLSLRPSQGSLCSASQVFELPDAASNTITSASGQGERLEDGKDDALVECSVVDTGDGTNFSINVRLSKNTVANYRARGVVSEAEGGDLDVEFRPTNAGNTLSLPDDQPCRAQVRRVFAGALWIDSLECQQFTDVRSPGLSCDSSGGLIFENCDDG